MAMGEGVFINRKSGTKFMPSFILSLLDQFWPTGFMFDTPALEHEQNLVESCPKRVIAGTEGKKKKCLQSTFF